jgi:hypothetical protein
MGGCQNDGVPKGWLASSWSGNGSSIVAALSTAGAPLWNPSCCCCGWIALSPPTSRGRCFFRRGPRTNVHCLLNLLQSSQADSFPSILHWIFLERQRSQGRCFLERYFLPLPGSSALIEKIGRGRVSRHSCAETYSE